MDTEPQSKIENDPLPIGNDADKLLADAAKRKKIEEDLRRMGMSPFEVQKLLNADSHTFDGETPLPAAVKNVPNVNVTQAMPSLPLPPLPVNKGKPARPSVDSMQAYAAELMAQKATAQVQAIREVSLDLPPFRESSIQEVMQAEPLLRDAAMLRRKEKFRDAEIKVREALQFVPKDAAALELLGDILQGVARTDEALATYKRALEADPKRSAAERKYGELLVLQQNWNLADPEAMDRNPWFARLLSLILPGLGQFHNLEIGKGILFLGLDALCFFLLRSPYGFGTHHPIGFTQIACIILTVVVYSVALIDTNIVVKQGPRPRSGSSGWSI